KGLPAADTGEKPLRGTLSSQLQIRMPVPGKAPGSGKHDCNQRTVCSVLQLRTAQPGDHLRQPASAGEVPRPAPPLACPRHHRSRSLAVAADRQDLYATIGSEWYFPTGKPNLLCAAEAAWSFGDHLGRWEKKRVGNLRGPPGIQEHPHQGLAKPVDGFPGIS